MTNKDNLEQFPLKIYRVVITFIDKHAYKTYWQWVDSNTNVFEILLRYVYYLSIFSTVVFFYNNRTVPNIINVERFIHSYNKLTSIQNVNVWSFQFYASCEGIESIDIDNIIISKPMTSPTKTNAHCSVPTIRKPT